MATCWALRKVNRRHVATILLWALSAFLEASWALRHLSPDVASLRKEFSERTVPMDGTWHLKSAASAGVSLRGPCVGSQRIIRVSSEADILSRTQFPSTTPVLLLFPALTLKLSQGLFLNSSFACTRMQSAAGAVLEYDGSDVPVLTIAGTSNIWITGISIQYSGGPGLVPCTLPLVTAGSNGKSTCPGVYIVNSYGIQITNADIVGRIDVYRSMYILLDHINATLPTTDAGDFDLDSGVVNFGQTSTASVLVNTRIVLSNSEISGARELVTLSQGATGVKIANNFLHTFDFAAVRCGGSPSFIMDCFGNSISGNYIYNSLSARNSNPEPRNSGIYFSTKWFSPGNIVTCNAVFNQKYCYLLDNDTSGVTISGGKCSNSVVDIRIQNGKYNTIQNVISEGAKTALSVITCSSLLSVNCFQGQGNNWEGLRRAYYNSQQINNAFPTLSEICNPVPVGVNSVLCNPPNGPTVVETGYCSGLPYGNNVEVLAGDPPVRETSQYSVNAFLGCQSLTTELSLMNNLTWVNTTGQAIGGVGTPSFRPWSTIGPRNVGSYFYWSFFNLRQPVGFQLVLRFNVGTIGNASITVPISEIGIGGEISA